MNLFNPSRFRVAREFKGISKTDLASRVGVTAGAISQYEHGISKPSPSVLAKVSLTLGLPNSFFSAGPSFESARNASAHFRSLRSTPQRDRDSAFAFAILTWEVTNALERRVKFPELQLPLDLSIQEDDSVKLAEQGAQHLRQLWSIPEGPISNVANVIESKGVVVTRLPDPGERVHAFSCSFPHRPVIVMSGKRDSFYVSRFDKAHELGHLILHHDAEPGSRRLERQAHVFASTFLMPTSAAIDLLPKKVDWDQLMDLKITWGMSLQALLYRCREMNFLAESTYRRGMATLSKNGRSFEPRDDIPAERPVLLSKALHTLESSALTIEAIANELDISLELLKQIAVVDNRPTIEVESPDDSRSSSELADSSS